MQLTRRQWLQSVGLLAGACATDALWLEPSGVRYVPRFSDDVSILLEHCPTFRDHAEVIAARDEFAVMLAGHTHGGQIAPLGWAPIRPPGSGRYVRGWYRDRDRVAMYVSRGLGTSVVPARFFSPPELAVFQV